MTILHEILRRITTTRHSRALDSEIARQGGELARQRAEVTRQRAENDQLRAAISSQQNEIARLRAENRALLNSILGIAGIPPVLPEWLPDPPSFFFAGDPAISDTPLPSSVPIPAAPFTAKCHSESAAADDESRSTPSHPSSTAAEKNSPGPQIPRNDIPPKPSPESSSLRWFSHSSPQSPPVSSSPVEGQGFSPAINDRAKRDSVGGRSFSSDINDRREAPIDLPGSTSRRPGSPSSLPKAVAEGERPQRQGVSPRQPAPRRQLPTPLRRRSWHQIMRTLEFESGKKASRG